MAAPIRFFLLFLAMIPAGWPVAADEAGSAPALMASAAPLPRAMTGGRECTVPVDLARLSGSLPRTGLALREGGELRIVAIGSSSTEGIGASDRAHAYPPQLERELAQRFPMSTVRVLNKGVGGELASDMVKRLERDAIDQRPTLVIWQTGTNDANRGISRADFLAELRQGVERLRQAGVDVLVIDPQYTPRVADNGGGTYEGLFDRLPPDLGVAVFHREAVMRYWVDSGRFTFSSMLAGDRFHMNDRSYRCLALVLADAIERAAAE